MTNLPINRILPDASQLVFGCMSLGGDWGASTSSAQDLKHAHAAIDAALAVGINFFDHADIYCRGKAESVFGEVLKLRPELRDEIYLQSKCGIKFEDEQGPQRYDFSRQWICDSVEGSLTRLGVEQLDILELHRPDPLMNPEEVAEAFTALKAAGKVKYFGVSNMSGTQMQFLQSYLPYPLVSNQLEMSLQRHSFVDEGVFAVNPDGANINFAAGTLEYCGQNDVQIQSWGSLAQGLYTGKDISDQPIYVRQTADKVAALAGEFGVSAEAIVLAWLLRHPANIQPVIGTANPERITACGQAGKVELSREQWYSLYVSARGEPLP
ncbi:MAG: aldo/keto reductase [Alteromonadaceae bacterium]|nr:MAG: aldo/keto reductase [Alteromonadaceae bacterium]